MIQMESVSKVYRRRTGEVRALDDVDLEIGDGQFVVVRGPSGSGKTTLLLALGGMLHPTRGRIRIDETDVYGMSDRDRTRFRAEHIGFVFQMFHLVPYLNVTENVLLPAGIDGGRQSRTRAAELLERFGLSGRAHHKPAELSAGERQRVAIARAALPGAKVILADEPTGNLDADNAAEVIGHLAGFHRDGGTVVVVTHGQIADEHADRVLLLRDGRIQGTS